MKNQLQSIWMLMPKIRPTGKPLTLCLSSCYNAAPKFHHQEAQKATGTNSSESSQYTRTIMNSVHRQPQP